jgi:hypothetical protein
MHFGNAFDLIVRHDMKAGITPFLLGEPGIGKSAAVAAIAESIGGHMFTVACNHLAEKADLTGVRTIPVSDDNGNVTGYKQVFFPMEDITDCVSYADTHPRETVVLFLDELNRTSGDVTSALLSLQTARRIGTLSIPKNVFMVCAGNDKGNVTSLDDASVSRFQLLHMEPDAETWLRVNPEAHEACKKVLKEHPELVFCREMPKESSDDDDDEMMSDLDGILLDGSEMRQFTTPRTITYLSQWLSDASVDDLRTLDGTYDVAGGPTALEETIWSIVGKTAFASAVLAELHSEMMSGMEQATNAFRVPRPTFMDDLYACKTRTDIAKFVDDLSDEARGQAIVSALCEPVDRRAWIDCLTEGLDTLSGDSLFVLMQANHSGCIDRDNFEYFKENTPAGKVVANYI